MVYLVGGTRRSEQTLMGPSSHKVRSGKTHDLNGQRDFTATGNLVSKELATFILPCRVIDSRLN